MTAIAITVGFTWIVRQIDGDGWPSVPMRVEIVKQTIENVTYRTRANAPAQTYHWQRLSAYATEADAWQAIVDWHLSRIEAAHRIAEDHEAARRAAYNRYLALKEKA